MRHLRSLLLLLVLLASIGACSPGHIGSNEIAFLRDGHLWTIDPDGANAFEVVANGPVIGYGWSPTHQILTFRSLDLDFAKTVAAKHILGNPLTQIPGDVPSTLNTIGIDGGIPIPIIFSNPSVQYSNAWWNSTGNRLIYREETTSAPHTPGTVLWWISQNDQPGGIARKLLPASFSIPSITADNSTTIGNSSQGLFTTTLSGTHTHYIVAGALPGHPLIATLERVLWQPTHTQPALLYALPPLSGQPASFSTAPTMIQLMLRDIHGHLTIVTTCACTQFAWSPDGNAILYSTGPSYTIYKLRDNSSFTFSAENGSVPYWSSDSQFLLLDSLHSLSLVRIIDGQRQVLLSDNSAPSETTSGHGQVSGVNDLLQPLSNSLWASDSRHFIFLTRGRLSWQGKKLSSGAGLYTVSIADNGKAQDTPTLVDSGNDTQAGWMYEDPNTSFLF